MGDLLAAQKEAIWTALDALAKQHRGFPDARWVLPQDDLARIEELAAQFEPSDVVAKHRYLFESQAPNLGVKRTDFQAYDDELTKARREAIEEIFATEGTTGIERLLVESKEPFFVGWTAAQSSVDASGDDILLSLEDKDQQRAAFALGFASERSGKEGIDWVKEKLAVLRGHPAAQARLLRVTRIFPDAWRQAEKLGPDVDSIYWKEFVPLGLGNDFRFLNETARLLLAHERAGDAVDLLAMYADRAENPPEPTLAADALEALASAPEDQQRRVSEYELQRLLGILREAEFDNSRVALLEWRLLPGLGYGSPAPSLERQLAQDPPFFVQILSLCMKRADDAPEERPDPGVAQNAFRLLHGWRTVPGSSEPGGVVNEAALRIWLDDVAPLLKAADRYDIGLSFIGQVFARARSDDDGTWPTKPIRDTIERLASDKIELGFRTQIYNNRGVTSRGLTDGGAQERELAKNFETWESTLRNKWPRTAAVLRVVAQGYKAEAQQQDEEAERFKHGLDTH